MENIEGLPQLTVRRARRSDVKQITNILRVYSVHARGAHSGKKRSLFSRLLSAVLRPLYSSNIDWRHCLVAEAPGGELVGCGKILPRPGGNWEVASLSVVKNWRGSGIALIGGRYIIEHAPRPLWGICERKALNLYRRFGAVEVSDPAGMPAFMAKRLATYTRMMRMSRRQGGLAVVVVR